MEFNDRLLEEIVRIAEMAADDQGLEGAAREEALVTIIEEVAVAVGDEVARKIMQRKLAADPACTEARCPDCGAPGLRKGSRRREILTRRGLVELDEPECYCRTCRRSFFPSVARAGAGRGV